MNLITNIVKTYNKGKLYDELERTKNRITKVNRDLVKEKNEIEHTNELISFENKKLYKQIDILNLKVKETDLDIYLKKNAKKIRNIAYKEKRYFHKKPISIFLNELIQRDSWEVLNLKRKIQKSTSTLARAKSIGNKVSLLFRWTDDKQFIKSGDYYVQPNEAIVYKKVDCEDHAFVNASLDIEIGVVYGFMKVNGKKIGHAWNCFVHKGKLYYLETTGNRGNTMLVSKADDYDGRFVVTKNNTYRIGPIVNFGKLAEYKWGK